jgi:hypothetical protein
LNRQTMEKLPAGNVLVIEPTGPSDLWKLGETLESAVVGKQESDSPLMTHVRLENVLMPEAKRLELLTENAEVLVASLADDPLYAAIKRPKGKLLVLTVNLEKGDLPLRTAFPILMTNALSWFQGDKGELREAIAAGSTVEVTVSELGETSASDQPRDETAANFDSLVLRSPDGRELPLSPDVASTIVGPLDRCGVWSIARKVDTDEYGAAEEFTESEAAPLWQVACNLADPEESDLRPRREVEGAPSSGVIAAAWGGRPLCFYLVALALALSGTEWFLYQRRWIS